MSADTSSPFNQRPRETSGLYLGVLFAAAQAFSAIFQYPTDYKLPALMALALMSACILTYCRSGVGSLGFAFSLIGTVVALGICFSNPIGTVIDKVVRGSFWSDGPPSYYVTITVFSDEGTTGIKDALDKPVGKIKIEVLERDDTNGMRGFFPQVTNDFGVAQVTLPRAGRATIRVCRVSQQQEINENATSPSRTQQIVIGIPPILLNNCERP